MRLFRLCLAATLALLAGVAASDGMTIAVIGTGDMGDSLGPRLAELGYSVTYGTRDPESEHVKNLLIQTGNKASASLAREAAESA